MLMPELNRRREARRDFGYPVYLDFGDDRDSVECRFLDISRHGARLLCSDTMDLPPTVILKLSETGASKRLCSVAWATSTEIGIKFVRVSGADRSRAEWRRGYGRSNSSLWGSTLINYPTG